MTRRLTLLTGTGLGALAVILGASGAHGLKPILEATGKVSVFELANRYHFYHALALVLCGMLNTDNNKLLRWSSLLLFLGVLFFSGSLYIMSFYRITLLGPITPIGGICLIIGWLLMLISFITKKPSD